ncbi:MAG: hypothetical protein JNL08_02250 [Planctomycetes bacterium]|nr:hypothetical protein [Planctomycetota bacterium]
MRATFPFAVTALAAAVAAQSGTIPGLDGRLTNNASPSYFGRRGAAHPNGEVAMACSYSMCNPGTVPIQWTAPMNPNHPMFAMSIVRESNGRFEQITDASTTYVKHAFGAANSASTCGGTCQSSGTGLRVNCTDVYGAGLNANRFYLGPASEIDPWTGVWNPIGSYFDRGDPEVAPPSNTDGVRSLQSTSGGFPTDAVKNRITLKEQDLLTPGTFYYCCHIVVRGEDGDLHWDNLGHRQMTATWTGTTWTFAVPGAFTQGSVLQQWTGAQLGNGRNGEDDGHFVVAVKVTPLAGGTWHYEYAVQNFDNHRGGASLRIPVCPTTTVTNITFRDTNDDLLDEWTATRVGGELVFSAPASNPLDWNHIYNFGFDCDIAPEAGDVVVDQARVGPGALSVSIATQVPAGIAEVTTLGPGCGAPAPTLATNGLPLIPGPGFALLVATQPAAPVFVYAALGADDIAFGACHVYVDAGFFLFGSTLADGNGDAQVGYAIPNDLALEGLEVTWQAAVAIAGAPLLGFLELSNGLTTTLGTR